MRRAVELARGNPDQPFGCVIVDGDSGEIIAEGLNRVHESPLWHGETEGIRDNIEAVNALYDTGKVEIILTTSRKEKARELTLAQIEQVGIKYHQVIFGLVHGRRIVINDYAKTNPYKSCEAINIKRNSNELKEMLEESIGFYIDTPQR